MGRGIAIIEPLRIVATDMANSSAGFLRLLTPNPKEAYVVPSGSTWFDVDFGAVVQFNTVFAGYANSRQCLFSVEAIPALAGASSGAAGAVVPQFSSADGLGDTVHAVSMVAAPLSLRYARFVFVNSGAPFSLGVVAFGLSFQTEYGEERGGGGIIEDTGTVERLFGGGFGIDEGVATTGYQWTFGDLQDAERRQLFQIVKRLRTTKSFLMVENPAQTDGLNERIHWGNLRKLEAYERIDPRNSKWALSMWDWS